MPTQTVNVGRPRNFRKPPEWILESINNIPQDAYVVACTRQISVADIEARKFAHLNITLVDGQLHFPDHTIPMPSTGLASRINVNGREIRRRDLPKVNKTFSWVVPHFGDWSRGSHLVSHEREVYQRELVPPKELAILITQLDQVGETFVFKFQVGTALHRTATSQADLLDHLNLLQENVGAIGVYAITASDAEYLKTVDVQWELLPEGTREDIIVRLIGAGNDLEVRRRVQERYQLLASLKPEAYIRGTSGFRRYFGAKFADDLVIFENIEYGNAIYMLYEDWVALSKLSRTELLARAPGTFERIVHRVGWEEVLKRLIATRLRDTGVTA